MRSNWSATCRACFSLESLRTIKCGLRTSSQFSGLSRAGASSAASTVSSKKIRLDMCAPIQIHRKSRRVKLPKRVSVGLFYEIRYGDSKKKKSNPTGLVGSKHDRLSSGRRSASPVDDPLRRLQLNVLLHEAFVTFEACGPFGPWVISNST
jgi:hypothetical protein